MGEKTIRRLENGDAGVSIGNVLSVLWALGLLSSARALADPDLDEHGKTLDLVRLPKHIRHRTLTLRPHKTSPARQQTNNCCIRTVVITSKKTSPRSWRLVVCYLNANPEYTTCKQDKIPLGVIVNLIVMPPIKDPDQD